MTVNGNTIRCDAYGCRIGLSLGIRPPGATTTMPEDVRKWFAMDGWTSTAREGVSGSQVDYCPLHRRPGANLAV